AATLSIFIPAMAMDGDFGATRGPLPSPVLPAVQANISNSIVNTDATSAAASQQAIAEPLAQMESANQSSPSLETLRLQNSGGLSVPGQNPGEPPFDPLMPASIAQSVSRPDDTQQFDLTPIKIPERGAAFSTFDSYKARMLYRLPSRMFFS